MKYLIVALLLCVSCAPTFFGARMGNKYYYHFNNQLTCAWVSGWQKEPKCMCVITDPKFSQDKTFLEVKPFMCEE